MSSRTSSVEIWDQDDEAVFPVSSPLTPPSAGMRRVDKQALSSSDEGYVPLQLTQQGSKPMPRYLDSVETLTRLGFTQQKADQIFQRWCSASVEAQGQFGFLGFILNAIDECSINAGDMDSDAWLRAGRAFGLTGPFATRLWHTRSQVHLTHDAKFWAKDTLSALFRELHVYQAASKKRGRNARAKRKTIEANQGAASRPSFPTPVPAGVTATQTNQGSHARPLVALRKVIAPIPAGYIELWKGLDVCRTFDLLKDDGTVNRFSSIISNPPGDFNTEKTGYYFAKQKSLAQIYARYQKECALRTDSFVCLVRILIPRTLLDTLETEHLYYNDGDKWRVFVWTCRQQEDERTFRADLKPLFKKQLLVGACAKASNKTIESLESPNDIAPDHLLGLPGGGNATQFFFHQDVGEQLAEQAKIEIYNCDCAYPGESSGWIPDTDSE